MQKDELWSSKSICRVSHSIEQLSDSLSIHRKWVTPHQFLYAEESSSRFDFGMLLTWVGCKHRTLHAAGDYNLTEPCDTVVALVCQWCCFLTQLTEPRGSTQRAKHMESFIATPIAWYTTASACSMSKKIELRLISVYVVCGFFYRNLAWVS